MPDLFSIIGTGVSTIASVAGAAYQMREGRKMMDQAMDAMDELDYQNLENVYKNIDISTAAQDMQREETARTTATAVDAASKTGARGVVGSMQDILDFQTKSMESIAAQLEEKQQRRDELIAADEARIREIRESRTQMEAASLANLYATGYAERMKGLEGLTKTASAVASSIPSLFGEDDN